MIPIRLHLSGFLSYHDPVDLDFTTFDLACISGSNGAGKSSLLDAITWALFGQARRRDDAVINSHSISAEVVYDFQYEGNLYRVQRIKPRDKPTVLEFLICTPEGEWKPLTEKSMRDTEGRIAATLRMDYDTFINSSFLMQGHADQFAQQRPGDRKKVLSSILGLEVWEQYRADTAERRKVIEGEVKGLEAQLADIDSELSEEAERKQRLHDVEVRLEQLNQLRKDKENWLAMKQHLAAMLEEQRHTVELLERNMLDSRARYNRYRTDLEALQKERADYQQVLAGEMETKAAYQHWQDLRAALERWDGVAANFHEVEARRAAPLTAIAAEESRLDQERQSLAAQEQAVFQEQSRLEDLDKESESLLSQIKRLENELSNRSQIEVALQEYQARVAEAQAENRSLRESMKSLKERIDNLNEVSGAVCPLCGQPLSQEERENLVSSLEGEGKEMGDRYRANMELQTGRNPDPRVAGPVNGNFS
jgi:exonuclease SbcC